MAKAWIHGNVPLLQDEEDIAEAFESIQKSILWHKGTADALREKVNYLESENYKDEELHDMKTRLQQMQEDYWRGFPISKNEEKAVIAWQRNHDETEHDNYKHYHGSTGGGYIYEFVPTSLGTFGTCICSTCRTKANRAASLSWNEYRSEEYHKYMKEHDGEFEFQEP